jgi:hypothetical protein
MNDNVLPLELFLREGDEQRKRNRQHLPGPESIVCGSEGSRAEDLDGRIKTKAPKTDPPNLPVPAAKSPGKVELSSDARDEAHSILREMEECLEKIRKEKGSGYQPARGLGEGIERLWLIL